MSVGTVHTVKFVAPVLCMSVGTVNKVELVAPVLSVSVGTQYSRACGTGTLCVGRHCQ